MLLKSSRIVTAWITFVMVLTACSDQPDVAYKELLDDDPQVRADAVVRLGQARAGDAVKSLLALLDDPDEIVRLSVIRALAQIGDPGVVPELANYMDDPLQSVRLQVCQALGEIGSPEGIAALEQMLYDPDDGIRMAAARNLGLIDHQRALDVLVRTALHEENEIIRQNAVKVIGRSRTAEAIPIFELALASGPDTVRSNAANVLGMLGDVSSIAALVEALRDPYPRVRSLSAHSLRAIGPTDASVTAALNEQLAVEKAGMVRTDLAWNLVLLGEEQHLELLRNMLLGEGPEEVQAGAARALGEVGKKSDIKLLEKALNNIDKKELVRSEVFKAIEKLKEA